MATRLDTLAASETVYFHAPLFAREKKLLDSMALLHTEKKYDISELAEAILAAAFIDADARGVIRLQRDQAKRLFGLRKVDALFVHPGSGSAPPAGTYEAKIREAVANGPKEVERVVHAILGEDHTVPGMLAIAGVLDGLAQRNLLEVREKKQLKLFKTEFYHMPDGTKALGAKADGAHVRATLDAWRTRPDWPLLEKGIQKGIASRKEAADGPD